MAPEFDDCLDHPPIRLPAFALLAIGRWVAACYTVADSTDDDPYSIITHKLAALIRSEVDVPPPGSELGMALRRLSFTRISSQPLLDWSLDFADDVIRSMKRGGAIGLMLVPLLDVFEKTSYSDWRGRGKYQTICYGTKVEEWVVANTLRNEPDE